MVTHGAYKSFLGFLRVKMFIDRKTGESFILYDRSSHIVWRSISWIEAEDTIVSLILKAMRL